ncbi:MAG: hypothetical protein KDC43_14535 [Saprospiraceae bacterium]|nr:hypothetical protein [Saprospiraceae bacterium]
MPAKLTQASHKLMVIRGIGRVSNPEEDGCRLSKLTPQQKIGGMGDRQ